MLKNAHLKHLSSSEDLITPYEATRAGFVSLALEKNRRATPTIVEARNLKAIASKATNAYELLNIKPLFSALLTASGVSKKASTHMLPQDKEEAIKGLIKNFLEPAGSDFVEELVYRYLLIRGDSLGGSMRNIVGQFARQKLARTLIGTLGLLDWKFYWYNSQSKSWIQGRKEDADIELYLKGLSWVTSNSLWRTLLFDRGNPIVKKRNIDLTLFDRNYREISRKIIQTPSCYLALGELKGGIDPAGADEHWKTARTALLRIRNAFLAKGQKPHLFFIGAAIEKNMSEEIWEQLEQGKLQNAANLTNSSQLASLCSWLCQI